MEKKVMQLILIIMLSLSGMQLSAQGLRMLVKKGSVNQSGTSVKQGTVAEIKPGDKLKVPASSLALVLKDGKIFELKPGKVYAYKEILAAVSGKTSYSSAFIKVISNQDYSTRAKAGISTRGDNLADSWEYQPGDSMIIMEKKIVFSAGGAGGCSFQSPILIRGANFLDSIVTLGNNTGRFERIPPPGSGEFFWEYKLRCNSKTKSFRNNFIIPDPVTKESLLRDYENYKKEITEFSSGMQKQLLEDYCFQKKLYFNQ